MIYRSALGCYAWTPSFMRRRFPKLETALFKFLSLVS